MQFKSSDMGFLCIKAVNQTGAFYFSQACSEDVFNFFQKQTNDSYRFISELMDVFLMAGVHQLPEQSNYLAEGHT